MSTPASKVRIQPMNVPLVALTGQDGKPVPGHIQREWHRAFEQLFAKVNELEARIVVGGL